jgi:hypothetical protein
MGDVDKKEAWLAFASKLYELGKRLYDEADFIESKLGAADPKVIALTLLCRSMSHVEGAVAMIERGLIVEARTLTRCCYENLIWMDGLAGKGVEFVKQITGNEYAYKNLRGKVILEWAAKQEAKPQFEEKLRAYMAELKEKHPDAKPIGFKAIAASGVLKDTYVVYTQLSSDAAHPSAESLSRYITRTKVSDTETTLNINALPSPAGKEILQTLEFACSALLGICVGANQIIGDLPSGKELAPMFEELLALRKGNAANPFASDASTPAVPDASSCD